MLREMASEFHPGAAIFPSNSTKRRIRVNCHATWIPPRRHRPNSWIVPGSPDANRVMVFHHGKRTMKMLTALNSPIAWVFPPALGLFWLRQLLDQQDAPAGMIARRGCSSASRSKTMDRFQVSIHPMANGCRVRVEGIQNAKWLLNRLSQSFVFKSSEAIKEERGSSYSIFNVLYSSQISPSRFKKLLAFIPEVNLLLDPA